MTADFYLYIPIFFSYFIFSLSLLNCWKKTSGRNPTRDNLKVLLVINIKQCDNIFLKYINQYGTCK